MTRNSTAAGAGPVVVEIEGVTVPATFGRLADGLSALWESLRVLPLGALQADAFEYFLTRADAVERTQEFIERDGQLSLTFAMGGHSHVVRVRPVAGAVPASSGGRG